MPPCQSWRGWSLSACSACHNDPYKPQHMNRAMEQCPRSSSEDPCAENSCECLDDICAPGF